MKNSVRVVWGLLFCVLMSFACNSYRPNITIWEAAESGDTKAIQYYAKHNQNIDEENDRGDTALGIACVNLKPEIVEILLKNGALVNKSNYLILVLGMLSLSKDASDSLELENFSQSHREEMVNLIAQQLLKHGADANKIYSLENSILTPLLLAIQGNNLKIVQLLISSGADVNKTGRKLDGEELVPLVEAIAHNKTDIAKELIKHGADVNKVYNIQGVEEVTPLIIAIGHKNFELVKLLLTYGADPNFVVTNIDGDRVSPLMGAIYVNNNQIVEELIKHGADIKKRQIFQGEKLTPLELAIVLKNADMVKELLKAGAFHDDLTVKDFAILFSLAVFSGNEEIMKNISIYLSPDKDENYIFKVMTEAKQGHS